MNDHTAVALRALRASDAEALTRISNMPGVRAGTMRVPFEGLDYWQRRIANGSPDNTWIVAEVNGAVVGHGILMPRSAARLAHSGDVMLAVADDQAGRGIGTAILAALLDVADNWRGLRRLELEVIEGNEPAIRLYRRCGFVEEGRKVKSTLVDGVYKDTLVMARLRF